MVQYASYTGLEIVVIQWEPGKEKSTLFLRRNKCSAIEKGTLAISWAISTLNYYFLERKILLK